MSKAHSLHIGLNQIDAGHYGTNGKLNSCELDAECMYHLAKSQGYDKSVILKTKEATADAVRRSILESAAELTSGDMLLVTVSSHGAQVKDINGDEDDFYDETWVLYDRMLVDDEIYSLWSRFAAGVNIVVLVDACHSATSVKMLDMIRMGNISIPYYPEDALPKCLPEANAAEAITNAETLYYSTWMGIPKDIKAQVVAGVLAIGACQDNQTAMDGVSGNSNSKFTEMLLKIWNKGQFSGNYAELHKEIKRNAPPTQTPGFMTFGTFSNTFENSAVFRKPAKNYIPDTDPNTAALMTWTLRFKQDELQQMDETERAQFFKETGGKMLLDAYQAFNSISQRKGGEISGGCSISDRGWSCDVRGTIRF